MNKLKELIEAQGGLGEVVNLPTVRNDLSFVEFGTENLNDGDEDWCMPGYKPGYETIEGVEVLFAAAGDDADKPIAFIIYIAPGTDMLRGYVPKCGNCYDKENKIAYHDEDENVYSFSMEDMRDEVKRLIISVKKAHLLDAKLEGKVVVGFKKVHHDAKLPTYAHEGDAGMDVYAVEDVELQPGKATLVKTGLIVDIPQGYEIQVRARSGLALKENVTVWNSPGTIDAKYRGEIGVVLMHIPAFGAIDVKDGIDLDDIDPLSGAPAVTKMLSVSSYKVKKGDKIAQLVLAPVTTCHPVEVQEVSETDRGTGGFGSTGK